jgi:hypothetical protein
MHIGAAAAGGHVPTTVNAAGDASTRALTHAAAHAHSSSAGQDKLRLGADVTRRGARTHPR